jgi:hypothetical protein
MLVMHVLRCPSLCSQVNEQRVLFELPTYKYDLFYRCAPVCVRMREPH